MRLRSRWLMGSAITVALAFCFLSFRFAQRELEVGPYAPQKPLYMLKNTIWINGLPLPFSFAHGSWLGCERKDSAFDTCTLVRHNDRFNGGDGGNTIQFNEAFASCRTSKAINPDMIAFKSEQDFMRFNAIFLQNGDVLVPVANLNQCSNLLSN